jgi:hypothetical protein
MKQLGLHGKLSRKFKVAGNSKYNHFVLPNIPKRGFAAAEPAKACFPGITCYAYTRWIFISGRHLDLFDRKITC